MSTGVDVARTINVVIGAEVFFRPAVKSARQPLQWLIAPAEHLVPCPLTHSRTLFGYSVEDWHAARTSDNRLSITLRYRIDPSSGGDPPPRPTSSVSATTAFCAPRRVNHPPLTEPLQLHKLNYYKKSGTSVSYCREWSISSARGNFTRHLMLKQRCVI